MSRLFNTLICAAVCALTVSATTPIEYRAGVAGSLSSGQVAPYMLSHGDYGRITQRNAALVDAAMFKSLDTDTRFSWGVGAEIIAGVTSATHYQRFDHKVDNGPGLMPDIYTVPVEWRQGAVRVQQLFGEIKYRSLWLLVGAKERHSGIVSDALSSGDITRSSNSRPIPGVSVGFVNFQDIPLTDGWVQIDGEITYGKFTDSRYRRDQFNYYNEMLATDLYYTYKRCYFRTKPTQPLSITVGMQAAGQFGGSTEWYSQGKSYRTDNRGFRVSDMWKMLLPTQGNGDSFYEGNSLGSWDFKARWRFEKTGAELAAYFEWPWEDGSGIGRRNGWDGLWGLELTTGKSGIISGAVIEYLDFRNQSGPMHFAPGDHPGTTITTEATGADDYYNNDTYGAYANYGMAIGNPMVQAPIYNLDGNPYFAHCRMRGVHAAVTGNIAPALTYKLMYSWQQAWSNGRDAAPASLHDTSMMAEAAWDAHAIADGLSLKARIAFDSGDLRGDNFGALLSVSYSGLLNIK